ncbi:hypothetical protein AGMMS50230_20150 [Spirochaetia bacterium]|nr:hypothetical protein AGMMS50230_20150 [Spirochaetia bacterium]
MKMLKNILPPLPIRDKIYNTVKLYKFLEKETINPHTTPNIDLFDVLEHIEQDENFK